MPTKKVHPAVSEYFSQIGKNGAKKKKELLIARAEKLKKEGLMKTG